MVSLCRGGQIVTLFLLRFLPPNLKDMIEESSNLRSPPVLSHANQLGVRKRLCSDFAEVLALLDEKVPLGHGLSWTLTDVNVEVCPKSDLRSCHECGKPNNNPMPQNPYTIPLKITISMGLKPSPNGWLIIGFSMVFHIL